MTNKQPETDMERSTRENVEKKKRQEAERAEKNKKVLRDYKITPKK